MSAYEHSPVERFLKSVTISPLTRTAATFNGLLELDVTKEKEESCDKGGGREHHKLPRWPHSQIAVTVWTLKPIEE